MTSSLLKFLFFLLSIFFVSSTIAQDFQGKAYYISKTDVDMSAYERPEMTEEQKKRMADRLKSMFEKTYILTFNRTESIYKVEEQLENPSQSQGGGRFASIMSGAVDGIKYKNVKTNQLISEHELFGKLFLIKDELPKLEWKMSGETKQIGAYTCFKATATKTWSNFDMTSLRRPLNRDENNIDEKKPEENAEDSKLKPVEVVAWYTMQIPVNLGPEDYWGLPGLILEVNTDKTIILCSKIVLNPDDKFTIKQPSKGKEVTKEEYVDMATEKYLEMRENFRRGGGRQGGGR